LLVTSFFASPDEVGELLVAAGYLADEAIGDAVFFAERLSKPVLIEGPAGVGKTELAKTVARAGGWRLIRLQCYEGLDEARALYEWNYKKQLLRIQASEDGPWSKIEEDLFTEEFLLERPLLAAIRSPARSVLLIDEVDRVEVETEALLLEVLSEFQVSIPELGTVVATHEPLVFLTSNATRELSEALRRRCLYLHLGYPDREREEQIIRLRAPEVHPDLARAVATTVSIVRGLELTKPPSISESVDWARTLHLLGVSELEPEAVRRTLPLLLKHQSDIDVVRRELAF
jgi:MoxR-like ATPase